MYAGTRVVRGPDWKWGNQDGGEGHVGTVLSNTGSEGFMSVCWDDGTNNNYRFGKDGNHDLRVFDSAPMGVYHEGVICDVCSKTQLVEEYVQGMRWKCCVCHDFDLCHLCYMQDRHDLTHGFMRIDRPGMTGTKISPRTETPKFHSRGIFPGAQVKRGPTWSYGNADGGDGKLGMVKGIADRDAQHARCQVTVEWATGRTHIVLLGVDGKVDLKSVKAGFGPPYYRDHLPVLGAGGQDEAYEQGQRVQIRRDVTDQLSTLQLGHGGWVPDMRNYVGRVGRVLRVAPSGTVTVEYEDGKEWHLNPAALKKVTVFGAGDQVRILDDVGKVKALQNGHGGWNDNMKKVLGKCGTVVKVDSDGDLKVSFAGETWILNHECCELQESGGHHLQADSIVRGGKVAMDIGGLLEKMLAHAMVGRAQIDAEGFVKRAAVGDVGGVRAFLTARPWQVDHKLSEKSALHLASVKGQLAVVKVLLEGGATIGLPDENNNTALHYSAHGGHADVMECLINEGANLNHQNSKNRSALHVTVQAGSVGCCRVLLKHGANTNLKDDDGDTALHDAIRKNDVQPIVELLVANRQTDIRTQNNKGLNTFHHAALVGNDDAMKTLVKKSPLLINTPTSQVTPIHISALNGNMEVTRTLINAGANVNSRDPKGRTPIILCIISRTQINPTEKLPGILSLVLGQMGALDDIKGKHSKKLIDTVKVLLASQKADLSIGDENSMTPLHFAILEKQTDIAELLLKHGAPVNAKCKADITSLHLAVNKEHVACVRLLLKHGADINLQDTIGDTPMHDAIRKKNDAILRMLFNDKNGDFTRLNQKGFNVLHQAAIVGWNTAVELIVEADGDIVDDQKEDGFTALHVAALNGHVDVVRTLITKGHANLEAKEKRQRTPLLITIGNALQGTHPSIIELLVQLGAAINAVDQDGDTALHLTLMTHNLPLDLDEAPTIHDTQSELSDQMNDVCPGRVAMACFLVKNGADIKIRNKKGHTALDLTKNPVFNDVIGRFARSNQNVRRKPMPAGNIHHLRNQPPPARASPLPQHNFTPKIPNFKITHSQNNASKSASVVQSAVSRVDVRKVDISNPLLLQLLQDDDVYPMEHEIRGKALIFNNEFFEGAAIRQGAHYDGENLKDLFEQLHFDVEVHRDLTAKDMLAVVKRTNSNTKALAAMDMLIVAVLSHGVRGEVYGTDGRPLHIEKDIVTPFDGKNCPTLARKPKVFIIQACQGDDVSMGGGDPSRPQRDLLGGDRGRRVSREVVTAVQNLRAQDTLDTAPRIDRASMTHEKAHIIMAYSTVPGFSSWRQPTQGSWFVRALTTVFSEHAHKEHLLELLRMVRKKVLDYKASCAEDISRYQQLTLTTEQTTKRLFFFPGYTGQSLNSPVPTSPGRVQNLVRLFHTAATTD